MPTARPDSERRLRQAGRLARVLHILELVSGCGRWDVRSLAAVEECSERTIHRMLNVLELAGVPWHYDEQSRCYRVREDFRFPTIALTDEELLDQATSAVISTAPGLKIGKGSRATTRKLARVSKPEAAKLLMDAEQVISVLGLQMADHSKHQAIIRTAQWSLLEKKQLTGRYKSPYKAKADQLRLHPYRLCLVKQAWYFIARPTDSPNPHTYRIARFKSLRMLDASAEAPERFDLDEYFGDAWAVFRGDKTYDVEIWFSKDAAELVTETRWHRSQKVHRNRDGSVMLSFRVAGLDEIVHWVLGWSGRARVIQPAELRERVAEQLTAALALNSG
jgi:predicted DNA-binding transcriptional regulator YafY